MALGLRIVVDRRVWSSRFYLFVCLFGFFFFCFLFFVFCFLLLLLLLKGRCGFGLILWVVVVWFVFYFDFVGCRDFDFFLCLKMTLVFN